MVYVRPCTNPVANSQQMQCINVCVSKFMRSFCNILVIPVSIYSCRIVVIAQKALLIQGRWPLSTPTIGTTFKQNHVMCASGLEDGNINRKLCNTNIRTHLSYLMGSYCMLRAPLVGSVISNNVVLLTEKYGNLS